MIRLVKLAFQQHGISMPDEAREIIFPRGIQIELRDPTPTVLPDVAPVDPVGGAGRAGPVERAPPRPRGDAPGVTSTKAEGGLSSEARVIEAQARQVKPLSEGENLLKVAPSAEPQR